MLAGSAYGEGEAVGRQPIEKFTWTRMNSNFQLSNGEALGLGGTTDEAERKVRPPPIARALPTPLSHTHNAHRPVAR